MVLGTARADVGTDDYIISCRGRVNQILYLQSHQLDVVLYTVFFYFALRLAAVCDDSSTTHGNPSRTQVYVSVTL